MDPVKLTDRESWDLRRVKFGRCEFDMIVADDRKCRNCRYALRGHRIGEKCPECGRVIPPIDDPGFLQRHFVIIWFLAITVLGLYGCNMTYQHHSWPAAASLRIRVGGYATRAATHRTLAPQSSAWALGVRQSRTWMRVLIFLAWVGLIFLGSKIQLRLTPPDLGLAEHPRPPNTIASPECPRMRQRLANRPDFGGKIERMPRS